MGIYRKPDPGLGGRCVGLSSLSGYVRGWTDREGQKREGMGRPVFRLGKKV